MSKTKQSKNTCSSMSSSRAIPIVMLHVWAELIDYCSLRLANQSLTGKYTDTHCSRGPAGNCGLCHASIFYKANQILKGALSMLIFWMCFPIDLTNLLILLFYHQFCCIVMNFSVLRRYTLWNTMFYLSERKICLYEKYRRYSKELT